LDRLLLATETEPTEKKKGISSWAIIAIAVALLCMLFFCLYTMLGPSVANVYSILMEEANP
jgi:hypothetical protein